MQIVSIISLIICNFKREVITYNLRFRNKKNLINQYNSHKYQNKRDGKT